MREIDFSRKFGRSNKTQLRLESAPQLGIGKRGSGSALGGVAKYILDTTLAVAGLVVLLPMIAMLIVIVLMLQGRPVFIAHRRIGKNGVMFACLKFRTMVINADQVLTRHLADNPRSREEWNATRKLRKDPRVTPFGAIMRKSSVDEIPQLLNIILGNMSLVGPRPIAAGEAELYGVHYADYIKVRPGLTGLWQVSGRNETTYGERVQLDVRYIRERTILGDLAILIRTIPAVLRSRGSY
ncbi:sugar transferase [Rhizobium sp. S163]|uniref:sugar transferase n=1 Tax=Rhizobium sp. S163 TaxID=3055039 RepID=UPI0025A9CF28|nr:sugar transferase [Rhizobium sp. S163]MDM9646370.1 sugar transferase [Rhizobium sp. S163]